MAGLFFLQTDQELKKLKGQETQIPEEQISRTQAPGDLKNQQAPLGFLVGLKKVKIFGTAKTGDQLLIKIHTRLQLDEFAVVDGEVLRNEELLAQGQIKIFTPNPKMLSSLNVELEV